MSNSNISYVDHSKTLISVILNKKIVGSIQSVDGGYRYFPEGHSDKFAGDIFKTVREVKTSLEEE